MTDKNKDRTDKADKPEPKVNEKRLQRMQQYRLNRRRAHHEAMQMPETLEQIEIPDHPAVPKSAPRLIEHQPDVDEFLDHVKEVGRVAFDTEFIGEASYIPQLCLLQLATHEKLVLVDPFQDINLTPLWELIASTEITVIVHAGFQDLEPVWRHLGKAPANIFDTQIAAGFIGQHYPASLRSLVKTYLELEMPKGLTYTSWDARPLTQQHQIYAADDVRYLLAVTDALLDELSSQERTDWAHNEFQSLEDPDRYGLDIKGQCHRIDSSPYSPPEQKIMLARLVKLRDEFSQEMNTPPRSLIKDGLLRNLIKHPPGSLKQMGQMRGMPSPIVDAYGHHILKALHDDKPEPDSAARSRIRFFRKLDRKQEGDRAEGLYKAIVQHCETGGISLQMAASRREVEHLHFECLLAVYAKLDNIPPQDGQSPNETHDQTSQNDQNPDQPKESETSSEAIFASLSHVYLVQGWRGEFFKPVILDHVTSMIDSHRPLKKRRKSRKK